MPEQHRALRRDPGGKAAPPPGLQRIGRHAESSGKADEEEQRDQPVQRDRGRVPPSPALRSRHRFCREAVFGDRQKSPSARSGVQPSVPSRL